MILYRFFSHWGHFRVVSGGGACRGGGSLERVGSNRQGGGASGTCRAWRRRAHRPWEALGAACRAMLCSRWGKMAALRAVDARRHVRPAGRGGRLAVTTGSGRPPRVSSKSRAQWNGLRYVSEGGRDPSGTILHN